MSLEEITRIDNLKSWTSGVDVDRESINQLRNIAALPWVKWSKRFSLRAFLIIVTLFAALLAAIVRAIK